MGRKKSGGDDDPKQYSGARVYTWRDPSGVSLLNSRPADCAWFGKRSEGTLCRSCDLQKVDLVGVCVIGCGGDAACDKRCFSPSSWQSQHGQFWLLRARSANLSSGCRAEKYQQDSLVVKAMADESPRAQISGGTAAVLCQCVADNASHLCQRESLDTIPTASRMFSLWEGSIERETIAKLNENFWSNGCRIT